MRVAGHTWFLTLVLVALVCVLFPVIGFVIRRKWRIAVARKEEIKRLLILAAEETARAEREASFTYGTAAVSPARSNHCAVCYVPAIRRCAQCKSVRYCSFECQTVHWRQGHKLECRIRSITHQSGDLISDLGKKAAEQDLSEIPAENSESEGTLCKTANENLPNSDTSLSPRESWGMNTNVRVESPAEETITVTNSESSSNSFSGFSASTSGSESSDDSSVCESIISNEHDQSEEHGFVDSTLDIADSTSGDNNSVGLALSPSPKFASLVNSVDGFSTMGKLIHSKPGFSRAEHKLLSNGTLGSSMWKGKKVGPSAMYSGFWDKTLDSSEVKDDANDDTPPSRSHESTGNKESDPAIEAKDSVSDDASKSVGNNVPSPGPASSENDRMNSSESTNLSIMNSKDSNMTSYVTVLSSVSDQLKPKDSSRPSSSCFPPPSTLLSIDSSRADALSIHNLQSAVSVVSYHLVGNHSSTLKSAEIRSLPHDLARSEGHSKSSTKHVNNSFQSASDSSSQGVSYSSNPKSCLKTSVLKVVDQFRGSNLSKRFPLAVGVGSDTARRCRDRGLFPYELFVKIYNSNKVELRPFGLINCGNSCYANAVLQCLVFTPPLAAYFQQGLHSKACANKNCFTCEFESLILKSKDTKFPLSPKGILSTLHSTGNELGNGREEDAHEFLRHAIDTMQSICRMDGRVDTSGSLEEDTTLMGLTFGGFLRSKIKCLKCGGKSERQERMMDLTIEIEGEIATLEEALQRFTSTEALDGENKYRCVRCKSYEKAKKKLSVSEAPNVLTIALKRFQSGKFGKLNKPIQFPEKLDLAPFMSGTSDKSPIYRLYGVVVHLDVMNAAFSGHYVCYVKNIQNKWFKVDDSVVTAVDLERVLMKGAYMLFYARCSPRAPRLIRSRIASPDLNRKVNGKTVTTKPRRHTAKYITSSNSPDVSPTTIDSIYSKFHHLNRTLEDDSSSDNSSLISSNSDEGSCSTDSTRGSTSIDDFSDYIFGDSRHGWRRSSESDTPSSTSFSPLNSRHSPLSYTDRYDSVSPDATGSRIPEGSSADIDGPLYRNRVVDVERKGGDVPLPHFDTPRHRKVDSSRISSNNNFKEIKSSQRLESNHFNIVNSAVCCSKSRERTGQ